MQNGTVKFFNTEKGFGYIRSDDGKGDIYVQASALKEVIHEDDRVTFDVESSEKGLCAANVVKMG